MENKIIAGLATAFLLSAGAAVAQSNASSANTSSHAGTSASMATPADSEADKDAAVVKKMQGTPAYPKAEARLNRAEAQETKELNIQESQEVAANNRGAGSAATNSESMNSGATSPDRDNPSQPQ